MAQSSSQLAAWLERLESFSPVEIDLGLDRVQRVLDRLSLPSVDRTLTVAGTNGKGSSVAMLEAILSESGLRVGAYTSPHILSYNERVRLDRQPVDDATLVAAFERVDAARNDEALTYFEFGTLAALVIFANAEVDVQVLEIGLGGRLDAVNVIDPTASLITNIAMDHSDWLGDDLEFIAVEKAGVMRAATPTVYASAARPHSIDRVADEKDARLVALVRDYDFDVENKTWHFDSDNCTLSELTLPNLEGRIQVQNAAGVVACLQAAGFPLDKDVISTALANVSVMGRMQRIGDRWLLDVAHNPAAAAVLAETLSAATPRTTLIGMLDDKDVEGVASALDPCVGEWVAVTADSPRAIAADELARRIANETGRPCRVASSVDGAIGAMAKSAAPVLVTGSFFLVGPALQALSRVAEP